MIRRKFTQTKLSRALLIAGILVLFLFLQPRFLMEPLRALAATLGWPFENLFSLIAFETKDKFSFFTSIGELKSENERLEKERLDLLGRNARFGEVARENEILRQEIGLLPRKDYRLKAAEVIGRDVSGLGNFLTIDQGALDGIEKDMPAIVGAGVLVGRVSEVFPKSARVTLLSNPESLINGSSLETNAKGIVKGEHGLGLLFDMVLQTDILKAGDTVVTSGLGGDMPSGLLIGTLQEPRLTEDRLFQRASIVTPAKFESLRYLFILEGVQTQ